MLPAGRPQWDHGTPGVTKEGHSEPAQVPAGLTLPSPPPGPAAEHHRHGPRLPPQLHCHQPEAHPGDRCGGDHQHHHRHDCEHCPPPPQPAPSPGPPVPLKPLLCFLVLQKLNTEQSVSVPLPLSLSPVGDPWLRGAWCHSPALQAAPASLGSPPQVGCSLTLLLPPPLMLFPPSLCAVLLLRVPGESGF